MGPIYKIEFIWVWEFPLNWHDKMIPSQIHFLGTIYLPQKGPRARMLTLDAKIQSWAQKSVPGHEKTKDAG